MSRLANRRMRHWKQQFSTKAEFVWNKPVTWAGEQVEIGAPIPDELKEDRNRLRRFWEAHVIQLAEFEDPDVLKGHTGDAPTPAPVKELPEHARPKAEDDETDEDQEGVTEDDDDQDDEPDELVSKLADRKWVVAGTEEPVYPTKKAALEAAQAKPADEIDPLED